METVVIAQSGEKAQEQANQILSPDELELFVGDSLEIVSGQYAGTKGKLYYLDEDIMKILPQGSSHRLITIPTTIFQDPAIQIKREPTSLDRFVDIISLSENNDVQAFDDQGNPVRVYKVKKVGEGIEDYVVLEEKGTDTETRIDFTVDGIVVGIPRDLDFEVLRSQDSTPEKTEEEEEEGKEEEEEEIALIEEPIAEPEEEDVIIGQRRPEMMTYSDEIQKNDFIEVERNMLEPQHRTDPKRLQKIRRLMENAYQLRNDILEYDESRENVEFKPITYETLAKLLEETDFPLAKPVLNVYKTLYLDHTASYFDTENPQPDPTEYKDNKVQIQYLQDAVQGGIAYLEKELGSTQEIGTLRGQLPRLYRVLQPFYDTYFQVIGPLESEDKQPVKSDRDFFRVNPLETAEPKLLGFNKLPPAHRDPVTVDYIKRISRSYMRAIKPRLGKYGEKKNKTVGIVEQGDEAEVWIFILFPFLFLRDLGAIRSGKLAIDVGFGSSRPMTMDMIIEEAGGIREISEKGTILAVDPQGKHAANIELQDWFMGQEIYGNGLGDLLPYLRSIGLDAGEFTPEQQSILLKKIEFYRANLKKYLSKMREEANKILQNPAPVQNFSLLSESDQQTFLEALTRDEDILKRAMNEFKLKYPSWKENDLGIFAFLYLKYPDYVLATASGLVTVAQERKRVLDDQALQSLHQSLLLRQKIEQESGPLETNNCDHIENLQKIRMISDDDKRIQLMVQRLLPEFKGETVNEWIECRRCNQHLICEHEYLSILEKTHPQQKDIIHKRITLNFSDGIFNGKYICRVCGQPIAELEFDQNPEFDDEGRMMMGNAPITQEMETTLEKELSKLLEIKNEPFTEKASATSDITGKDEEKQLRLKVFDEIALKVGITLPLATFQRMSNITDRLLQNNLKAEETYNKEVSEEQKANPKSKFPNYTEYKNQIIISYCAAALLIEIQSAIPDVMIRSAVTECGTVTFGGYPLVQDDTQIDGIGYLACVLATLVRSEKPWGDTLWVRMVTKDGLEKRKASIQRLMMNSIKQLLAESEIQILLEKKREFVVKEKGIQALTGRYADNIPSDFLPLAVQPTEELLKKAQDPLVGDAASPGQKAFAWLLEGYRIAKLNGLYEAGNPLSEATCCYSPMRTPMGFWYQQTSLPNLGPKQPPQGPRGSTLLLKTVIRKAQNLMAEPDPTEAYRLFLRVCFRGPRIGLPHEPGYDRKCPYCEFVFPVDPRLPPPELSYSKDKKVQEKFTKEYTTEVEELKQKELRALQEAGAFEGASVDKEQFEELLQATNRNFIIPPLGEKLVTTDMGTINEILAMKIEPFTGFLSIMATVRDELVKLPRTTPSDDPQVYMAYGAISNKQGEFEANIKMAIDTSYTDSKKAIPLEKQWNQFYNATPQILGELLRTFILLPFQRSLLPEFKHVTLVDKKIMTNRKAIYSKIALEERKTLTKYLATHFDPVVMIKTEIGKIAPVYKGVVEKKIQQLIDRLTVFIPLFTKVLRANVIPFGAVGLSYIQRAILGGIFWEFINPIHTGGKATLRKLLFICFLKAQERDERTILSPDEVRKIIADFNESEKVKIINEFDRMTPEQKRAELIQKSLKMGRWARGAGVIVYDEEQQEFDKQDRQDRGITDFYGLSAVEKEKQQEEINEMNNGFDTYEPDGEEEEN